MRRGRPKKIDGRRDDKISVRVTDTLLKKIDYISENSGATRSEIVRKAIEEACGKVVLNEKR